MILLVYSQLLCQPKYMILMLFKTHFTEETFVSHLPAAVVYARRSQPFHDHGLACVVQKFHKPVKLVNQGGSGGCWLRQFDYILCSDAGSTQTSQVGKRRCGADCS